MKILDAFSIAMDHVELEISLCRPNDPIALDAGEIIKKKIIGPEGELEEPTV